MRKAPYMNVIRTRTEESGVFYGYNRQLPARANAFWDMKNMTGMEAPIIRTRDRRYKVRTLQKCNGMFAREALGWVDGTQLWYEGEQVGNVQDSTKTFVHMGAYTVIFPDKVLLNTHTGEVTPMENTVHVTGNVTYTPCDKLGNAVDYGSANYVKVAAMGVGKGFKKSDVVTITGSWVEGLNGSMQLDTVTDDEIILLGVMASDSVTQTGGLTLERLTPDMDYVTECNNRLWGCSSQNHEVYACKLGDPTNWRNYQNLASDAFSMTVGSYGDFTGAASHLGYVLFFKEHMIHKVFGDKPSNFQLTDTNARGVQAGSHKSLCAMNETLYYHSPEGMAEYQGALPSDAGYALGHDQYRNVRAGSCKGRMWACMVDELGRHNLFTLDGKTGLWHKEDNLDAADFASVDGKMYALDAQGTIWCLNGRGDPVYEDADAGRESLVPYMVETGELGMEDLYRKRLRKIQLRLEVDMDGSCDVDVKYDGMDWQTVYKVEAGKSKRAIALPIIPRRCDRMKIRIKGWGMMRLYNMNLLTTGGSDIG